MSTFIWPAEDGWPYPDTEMEMIDLDADVDVDLLSLRIPPPHLFDDLEPIERLVVTGYYGLNGEPARTLQQLHRELGVPTADLRSALGTGLDKLRSHLV